MKNVLTKRTSPVSKFKSSAGRRAWWTVLATVAVMSLAPSSTFAQFTGSVVPGSPSGGSGMDRHFGDDTRAVTAITYGERSDDPCFIRLENVDPTDDTNRSSETNEECGRRGVTSRSQARIELPGSSFATGIRVCLNRDGSKVKGIQLIGLTQFCLTGSNAVVTPAGTIFPIDRKGTVVRPLDDIVTRCDSPRLIRQVTHKRSKCDVTNGLTPVDSAGGWMLESACPGSDMAMIGLRLSTESGSGGREVINGITALCRSLIPRS